MRLRSRHPRTPVAHRLAPERPRLATRHKAGLALLTVLLVLGLLEGASRVFFRLTPNARWQSHRHLVETVGFPALNEILVPDDDLFWRLKPSLARQTLAGQIAQSTPLRFAVATDARGCRCLPHVDRPQHQVVFLGDSTTFGIAVDDDQTFPALIQRRWPGVQCLNLGVPGYTAYQGRRWLERFPFEASPDVVVITFGFNDAAAWDDLSDTEHARRSTAERARLVSHIRLITLLRQAFPPPEPAVPDAGTLRPRLTDDEFADELRAMIAWCRARQAEPVLMVWPKGGQLVNPAPLPKQLAVLRLAEAEHVRVVNLVTAFRARGDRALFADVIHASPAGCELVAATLLPVLQEVLAERTPPPTTTPQR